MNSSRSEQDRIGENAALLLVRTDEDDSPAGRAQLDAFVRSSVLHVRELLLAQAVATELRGIDPQRRIDIESLPVPPELPAALSGTHTVTGATKIRAVRWIPALAAALACLTIGAIAWLTTSGGTPRYSTAVGEQRTVKLPDGSIMSLNTASRVDIRYSDNARHIRLLDGEALFTVERDPARPFEVVTDTGTVRAIGTRFNVYRHASGVIRVSVLEGVVQITPREAGNLPSPRLKAGEEADVTRHNVARAPLPDVARTLSWRTRKLAFKDAALEEVAREFNRYNSMHLAIEGEPLRGLQVSGVFDADDVQPIIDFVSETPDLRIKVERTGDRIVIRQE